MLYINTRLERHKIMAIEATSYPSCAGAVRELGPGTQSQELPRVLGRECALKLGELTSADHLQLRFPFGELLNA